MSDRKAGIMADQLSKTTSIFGLRLWVVLGVCVGAAFVLFLFLISLWLASKRTKRKPCSKPSIPVVSKEIQEIKIEPPKPHRTQIQADPDPDPDPSTGIERQALLLLPPEEDSPAPAGYRGIHVEIGKGHRIAYPGLSPQTSGEARVDYVGGAVPEVSHLGWGHWYTLRELEISTNGFAHDKVIGEGGYGIVYHGILEDNTQVAVKNLLNNRGQAEKEFKVEVEAIGRVRHKNLVRLLGYCAEGAHRMLPSSWALRAATLQLESWEHLAPEYASTGMLNERSDVYSFGILVMEIITGRNPVDYSRPPEKVNLIEWLKKMVANRNPEGVLDPKLPEKPTSRALKRALLVALRCVDPNAQKRPKMGHVIHILEAEEPPVKDDSSRAGRDAGQAHCDSTKNESPEKRVADLDGHEEAVPADGA
ncbi:hypothetical protein V6N13_072278 [Hibiscus sabdariffa]|uniref:non-specific serine/threonine protein kinase n=1 Tax=Hibiscus sabdariffa TaxID=183260 RepID=A0ABR2R7Z7_9ROSI